MEQWKPIPQFEGIYEISNLGRVRSLDRYDNVNHFHKGRIMKQGTSTAGYKQVGLRDGKRLFTVKPIHRLVALAFLPNPNNLPCVNHIDENKENNTVVNLEWCTVLHNNCHGTRLERVALKEGKHVVKLDANFVIVDEYPSINEAARKNGLFKDAIRRSINSNRKRTSGGFYWEKMKQHESNQVCCQKQRGVEA